MPHRKLEDLKLNGNPVTDLPKYRGAVKHLIASLKHLDGSSIFFSDGNRSSGYGVRHQSKVNQHTGNTTRQLSPEHAKENGSAWNEVSHKWDVQDGVIPPSPSNTFHHTAGGTLNSSCVSTFAPEDDPTDLPWNRCPNPIPKDRKGKEMYEAPPSPYKSPVRSTRVLKAMTAKEKREYRINVHSNAAVVIVRSSILF
jgi:hypothetical protein